MDDRVLASLARVARGGTGVELRARRSSIEGAGHGLWLERGTVEAGDVVCGYAALLLAVADLAELAAAAAPSLVKGNRYVLARRDDGVLLDGNLFADGFSRDLWRRAAARDETDAAAAASVADDALGGRVNHASAPRANVAAVPVDVDARASPQVHRWLRRFTRPFRRGACDDVVQTAVLVARRRLVAGEELFLDYQLGALGAAPAPEWAQRVTDVAPTGRASASAPAPQTAD
jgi:hypothetical protein